MAGSFGERQIHPQRFEMVQLPDGRKGYVISAGREPWNRGGRYVFSVYKRVDWSSGFPCGETLLGEYTAFELIQA